MTLNAQAIGSAPLSYQWLSDGAAIPLATLPSLTASNLSYGQTLTFAVIVSNAFGAVTSATATVTVNDTTGPVITIIGAAATNILVGSAFTDPGAVAADACAGPRPVVTNGTVNPNVVGNYVLTYRSADPYGNSATNTRSVNVVPAAPVVTVQPGNHTNYPGATQLLTVTVTGATPHDLSMVQGFHQAGQRRPHRRRHQPDPRHRPALRR